MMQHMKISGIALVHKSESKGLFSREASLWVRLQGGMSQGGAFQEASLGGISQEG